MNVDSIIISEYATATDDGTLTIIRAVNEMQSRTFPAATPILCISLIIHAHRDERGSEHELHIRAVDQHRTIVGEVLKTPLRLTDVEPAPGMPIRHTVVHRIFSPTFGGPGPYAFEVFIDGTYSAAAAFNVRQI